MRCPAGLPSLAAALIMAAAQAQALATIEEWKALEKLPAPVYAHCLVGFGDNLILIGGQDSRGKSLADVLSASIAKDGALSKWNPEKALPNAVTGHSAAATGEDIYVCGGMVDSHSGRQASSLVWRARPSGSGRIRSWQQDRSMPFPLYGHGQVAYGKWIYLIGGMTSGGHSSKVLIGSLSPGGGIAEWRESLPLPVPLVKSAALMVGKYLLVAGGVTPGQGKTIAVPTVYAAPIWEDGSIKTWYLASAKLPGAWLGFGRSDATLVFGEKSLFCIGGQDALWFAIKNMARAGFNPEDGEMGEWGLMNLPDKFPQITQAVANRGRVYSVGGQSEGRATDAVWSAEFVKVEKDK